MNGHSTDPATLARRVADGEPVDLGDLDAADPELARGLRKLGALAQCMRPQTSSGARWGHLLQLEPVARGGFGEVFRAYDPTLDRLVALKLKRTDAQDAFSSGRDFVAEARRLARVRHPNVLAVHGASFHAGRAGLWSDWIDGETLAARISRTGAMFLPELLRVLHELAAAIDAVHRAGIVHGDIKAGNVMLDGERRVVLMDFGAGFDSGAEGSMVAAGTPRYLAPEVVAGGPATPAVDIYAFGVLAQLLASGHHAESSTPASTVRSPGLRDLIARCLEHEPAVRPSADLLRRRLARLIDAPRRRARRWLLASVLAGLAGILATTAVGLHREHLQRQRAERISALLASIFREQDPLKRETTTALSPERLIADAIARVDAELSEDAEGQAQLLRVMGEAQLHLSLLEEAQATLDRAIHRLGSESEPLLWAEIEALRGAVATRQLRSEDAQRHFDAALARATRAAGAQSVAVGRIEALAAYSRTAVGRHVEARSAAENAHRILDAALGADHPEAIHALVTLAVVLQAMRDDGPVFAIVQDAIARTERRYGPDDARLVRPLHVLGAWFYRARRHDEARAVLERGADIARRRIGPRSTSLGNLLALHGDLERAAGKFELALELLDQADRALPDDEKLGRAQLHSIRGAVHFALGDGARAESDFRRALALRDPAGRAPSTTYWYLTAQLGDALASQGRFAEADVLHAQAAEGTRALLGPDAYQNTLISTRRAGSHVMRGDWENAIGHTREAIRVLELTLGRDHPNHFAWNLDLAKALTKLPGGRAEAARISEDLIARWSQDPRVADGISSLRALRCELQILDATAAAPAAEPAVQCAQPTDVR